MTRWEGLFSDLEAQLAAQEHAGVGAEVDARTRGEVADLTLVDRLRAAVDQPVRVVAVGGLALTGVLGRVGPDFLAVVEDTGREALVPLHAVRQVAGLGRFAQTEAVAGAVAARLGWRSALRAVVRDRGAVRLHLVDGEVLDATLDRVGADHVELAVHAAGETRRAREVRGTVAVPFTAIAAVRRETPAV
ncbi:hypothetical protein ACXR2U_23320 [Jatrophihabitans sp. YIM 134969]